MKTSHTREPRDQPFPSRWTQCCKVQTRQYDRQTRDTYDKNDKQKKQHLGTVSKNITGGNKHV